MEDGAQTVRIGVDKFGRIAKQRYEIVIGEKGLAVLKTGCLGTNQGVGLIACSVIIDTNLRGLARVENVERNGEF